MGRDMRAEESELAAWMAQTASWELDRDRAAIRA